MSLAVAEPTPDGRADPGGHVRIHRVHVEAHVHEARPCDVRQRLADRALDAEAIDVAHREHLRIELPEQLALALIERANPHEGNARAIDGRKTPAVLER